MLAGRGTRPLEDARVAFAAALVVGYAVVIIARFASPSSTAMLQGSSSRTSALAGTTEDLLDLLSRAKSYVPQIRAIVTKAGSYLPAIQTIVEDPALPALAVRIKTLKEIETKAQTKIRAKAQKAGQPVPPAGPVGIGLRRAIKPIDTLIWAAQNRGKATAIVIAVPVAFLLAAFFLGRLSVRR